MSLLIFSEELEGDRHFSLWSLEMSSQKKKHSSRFCLFSLKSTFSLKKWDFALESSLPLNLMPILALMLQREAKEVMYLGRCVMLHRGKELPMTGIQTTS